ncbi:MAG: hypothetical protein ACFFDK_18420 [Promethearchaeota archaeon]
MSGRRILIINAKKILEREKNVLVLKKAIDEIKLFLKTCGGSIGRLGE